MKTGIGVIGLIGLIGLIGSGYGATVTGTLTVTNGTWHGCAYTLGASTRLFTNAVGATTILTNTTALGSASNLFNQVLAWPISGIVAGFPSSNQITFKGNDFGMTILSNGWATLLLETNVGTNLTVMVYPVDSLPPDPRTNQASEIIYGLQYASNSAPESIMGLSNYLSLYATQTASNKTFYFGTNWWTRLKEVTTDWLLGTGTNRTEHSLVMTNGQNFGNAFSSPGTNTQSEQFGLDASATGNSSLAVGACAVASGAAATAVGTSASASGWGAAAYGQKPTASGGNAIAIGYSATASGSNSLAVGVNAVCAHSNSMAIGASVTTTAADQILIGSSAHTVEMGGNLNVGRTNTVNVLIPTNVYYIAFPEYNLATLSGTNIMNPDVYSFIRMSGPAAAWNLVGVMGVRNGRWLKCYNASGHNCTVQDESGLEPTAAQRIKCPGAADLVISNTWSFELIYSDADSRWILSGYTYR